MKVKHMLWFMKKMYGYSVRCVKHFKNNKNIYLNTKKTPF